MCQLSTGIRHTADLKDGDVHLSYLPLAHVFEKALINICLMAGLRVGFYSGDVRKLLEDVQILKPNFFCAVPRLLNKIYDSMIGKVKGQNFILRTILEKALETKKNNLTESQQLTHWFYDRTVLKKMKNALGG